MMENKPLNIDEAAEYLSMKKSYLYQLVYHGKIASYKPGGKLLYFKREDLENYVYQNRKAADFELAERADAALNGIR
jgi:excisionase family DNA binding protein